MPLAAKGVSKQVMGYAWEGCFVAVFWLLMVLQWNSGSSQIIQYISRMGACLVVSHPSENDKSTLPSPTAYRAEIQAQLSEKPQPVSSSKKIRQRSLEKSGTLKSKSIIKTQSRSQIGSKALDSNRSLQLQAMDSGPRTVKQVVITKEKPAPSLKEFSEQRIVERDQDQEEEEEQGGSEESIAEAQPQMESPANRLLQPDGNMLNKGLTDTDNRMIALTMAAKEPLKLNAIKLINGSIYNGGWLQGKRHGRGTLMWEDGSRYEGEWRDNFSWGQGKLIYNQHEQYQGSFVRNCREGHGRYVNFGVEYLGEWRNDRRQGHGVETWGKGQHFQGEWVGGYKNGPGELHFQDGSYYKGEFSGNELHGHGVYCWMNSRTYEGEWQHNRMSGLGVMAWANGESYQGQFKNDKMHGLGSLTHPDKSTSTGVFQQGRKHGIFTEVDSQGNAKQIQYYMGKRVRGEEGGRIGKSNNNQSYTLSSVTVTNSF